MADVRALQPSTSTYIPLMGWYYLGIIGSVVTGTLCATIVLFVHSRKQYLVPVSRFVRFFITSRVVWTLILEPPIELIEIWTE